MLDSNLFGCPTCLPERPSREWARTLGITDWLIGDSHYAVQIRQCPACGQRFVHIFSEFIDWKDGDDAQYSDVVPITPAEAEALRERGGDVTPEELAALGKGRRRLCDHHPTGKPTTIRYEGGDFGVVPGY